jgi:hypothetical protein
MENRKQLIEFLKFIGIENPGMEQIIMESEFDLTDVALQLAANKIGESFETVKEWYERKNKRIV